MIQPRHISNVLSKGLTGVSIRSSVSKVSPLSISLVSASGIPLSSVCNKELERNDILKVDNLKIYCLLALSTFKQYIQENPGCDSTWTKIRFEDRLNLLVQQIELEKKDDKETETDNNLFVIMFYDDSLPDEVAKLKACNICEALKGGLRDYNP